MPPNTNQTYNLLLRDEKLVLGQSQADLYQIDMTGTQTSQRLEVLKSKK